MYQVVASIVATVDRAAGQMFCQCVNCTIEETGPFAIADGSYQIHLADSFRVAESEMVVYAMAAGPLTQLGRSVQYEFVDDKTINVFTSSAVGDLAPFEFCVVIGRIAGYATIIIPFGT